MFTWLKNWSNWTRLGAAILVVALNYIFAWGLSTEVIIGLGIALAIPAELWGFLTKLIAKLFHKEP